MARILCVQFHPKTGDKEFNLNKVEEFICENSDKNLDLIVLPEFFSTGIDHYSFLHFPEDENGGTVVKRLQDIAIKSQVNIVAGTVIESYQDKLYNTCFVLNREGEIVDKYRKIHLFNYNGGTEGQRITPGESFVVSELDFAKIGLNICYDFRYPMQQKKLVTKGAEILVCPTAWCIPNIEYENNENLAYHQDIWTNLNKIRAYDNLSYVVSCNQIGKSNDNVSCIGYSQIVSPEGRVLANAFNKECTIYFDLDLNIIKQYRQTYPISDID